MKNQSSLFHQKPSLFHQKLLSIQNFYYPLKRYLEQLPVRILAILTKHVSKVEFEIARTHHISKFSRYLTKILSRKKKYIEHHHFAHFNQ